MKTGLKIEELAHVLNNQMKTKRDFIVTPKIVSAYENSGELELAFGLKEKPITDEDYFQGKMTSTGHEQLGRFLGIPKTYYDTMLGHPGLLVENVKHWLSINSDRRMIRTLDGRIRGVLSDSYRALDNYDLGTMAIKTLLELGATVDPGNCQITERKMYIKALLRNVVGEVKKGDEVCAGIIIENSEIGYGSLAIKPLLLRKVCDNGMIINELASRKRHVGKKADEFAPIELANDTKSAEDTAFWLKVRDHIKHGLSEVTFQSILERMQEASKKEVKEPQVAVEMIAKSHGFTIKEKDDVMTYLLKGGDITNWGFANAVTRMAQDVESYDRSVELEHIGWDVLNQNLN